MWSKLGNYRDFALLVLRIGLGGLFVWLYGWPKLAGGAARWKGVGNAMKHFGITFAPEFWGFMAAASESLGAVLIVIGFAFRPACLLLFITMCVAATSKLVSGTLGDAGHPLELAFVFFALIFIGPGRFSVDKT